MKVIILCLFCSALYAVRYAHPKDNFDIVIAKGKMPNMSRDKSNNIHIVYGTGDSIMYVFSSDGISFSSPALVAVLPKLFASAMRGPQIAADNNIVVITACTSNGNIYSYTKEDTGNWTTARKVNEVNEAAKEALMALSSDCTNTYAVWLGVKDTKGQNVYGARSVDGGKTWSKNMLVYASPDRTVCECCKPSVAVSGNNVYVMFRNWLYGSRDLYLIKSSDGGMSFEKAQKLGKGSWKLNGCPMDGGGIVIDNKGIPLTVWRRKNKIFASTPGGTESELGEGRDCSMESINARNIYAWTQSGNVIVVTNDGTRINLGKGSLPLIKAINNDHVLCIYENENQIHASFINI